MCVHNNDSKIIITKNTITSEEKIKPYIMLFIETRSSHVREFNFIIVELIDGTNKQINRVYCRKHDEKFCEFSTCSFLIMKFSYHRTTVQYVLNVKELSN